MLGKRAKLCQGSGKKLRASTKGFIQKLKVQPARLPLITVPARQRSRHAGKNAGVDAAPGSVAVKGCLELEFY